MTSAGLLEAAGDAGAMVTLVPDLILSGWKEMISFDAGAGGGFFSRYQFGSQNFGGPAQFVATIGNRFVTTRLVVGGGVTGFVARFVGATMFVFNQCKRFVARATSSRLVLAGFCSPVFSGS